MVRGCQLQIASELEDDLSSWLSAAAYSNIFAATLTPTPYLSPSFPAASRGCAVLANKGPT
jgi:hypothetical protein